MQLSLDFVVLMNVNAGPTTLQTEYYIELPQTTWAMANGNDVAYSFMTYHGVNNLKTLSPEDVKARILNITLQDGPVDLQPADFGLTKSRTNGVTL
jgi:hypothetical protein